MAKKEQREHHRAKLKWVVLAKVDGKVIEGVRKELVQVEHTFVVLSL
jgi:hypothetical protein